MSLLRRRNLENARNINLNVVDPLQAKAWIAKELEAYLSVKTCEKLHQWLPTLFGGRTQFFSSGTSDLMTEM